MNQIDFEENARRLRLRRIFFRSFMQGLFIAQAFAWKEVVEITAREIIPTSMSLSSVLRSLLVAGTTTSLSMLVAVSVLRCANIVDTHVPAVEIRFARMPRPSEFQIVRS